MMIKQQLNSLKPDFFLFELKTNHNIFEILDVQ